MSETITPFSNGSEACDWYATNCEQCVKSWHPDWNKPPVKQKTIKSYIKSGKYCKLQYEIDMGFITGEIPAETYKQIWPKGRWYEHPEGPASTDSCFHWSGDDNDRWKPPKRPSPGPPANQLPLFTEFDGS